MLEKATADCVDLFLNSSKWLLCVPNRYLGGKWTHSAHLLNSWAWGETIWDKLIGPFTDAVLHFPKEKNIEHSRIVRNLKNNTSEFKAVGSFPLHVNFFFFFLDFMIMDYPLDLLAISEECLLLKFNNNSFDR